MNMAFIISVKDWYENNLIRFLLGAIDYYYFSDHIVITTLP